MRRIGTLLLAASMLGSCSTTEREATGEDPQHAVIDSLLRVAVEQERVDAALSHATAQRGLKLATTHGTPKQRAQLAGSLLYSAVQLDSMAAFARDEQAVLAQFDSIGDAILLTRHLRRMGDAHYRRTLHAPARAYYDRSMEVAREAGAVSELAEAMSSLGSLLLETSEAHEALALQKSALHIMDSLGADSLPRIRVLSNLGYTYYWAGEPDSAIHSYRTAIEAIGPTGNQQMLAWNLMNRGVAYIEKGLYTPAIGDLHRAYGLHRAAGMMFEAAACTYYLAYCHEHASPPGDVIRSYERAIAIYDSLGFPQRSMSVHGQLGRFLVDLDSARCAESGFSMQERDRLSLAHCRKGTALCRTLGFPAQLGDLLDGLCDAERAVGELDSALAHAQEALRIRTAQDFPSRTAGSYKDLGMVLHTMGRLKEAEQAYQAGLELLADQPHPPTEITLHDGLRSLYAHMGRYDRAYDHLLYVQRIGMSTFSETQRQELVQRGLQWNFDRTRLADSLSTAQRVQAIDAQRTIAELKAGRAEARSWAIATGGLLLLAGGGITFALDRKRRRERFAKEAAQLETKALRAQMDPHFIGNTLHAVNGYLLSNDPATASTMLSRFAKWIRTTLESSRHEEVPLHDDIEAMRTYLSLEQARTNDKFTFRIEVPDDEALLRTRIPPMLVQPLLENAVQHGIMPKEGTGNITLRVEEHGDDLLIAVEDDGVGRQATPRTERPEHRSLSTTITEERLALLSARMGRQASVRVVDLPQGMRVELRLPVGW
ncbi:MAG: tetratricopeptide repeat protein [Flavobacteriales bacterium]|nr:tetratricopeptide repeat protein [Flavobacteriales bacterium]